MIFKKKKIWNGVFFVFCFLGNCDWAFEKAAYVPLS